MINNRYLLEKNMKLNDLDKKNYAPKALQENYKINFDVSKLGKFDTQSMLRKVRTLANEAILSNDFQKNKINPSYMKLVFMEEALVEHYNTLLATSTSKIVLENEAVEEAQVVLAAQDMCDTIQKMLKDIGQMQIEELPALVDSIESEIGANEARAYNDQVSSQLDTLNGALKAAFAALKSARDSISTGTAPESFTEPEDSLGIGDTMPDMDIDAGADVGAEMDTDIEPTEPLNTVGREKR